MGNYRKVLTLAQETAMTIFAPAFAIPLASDFEPTYETLALKSVRSLVIQNQTNFYV
jgi:hypothetical protein